MDFESNKKCKHPYKNSYVILKLIDCVYNPYIKLNTYYSAHSVAKNMQVVIKEMTFTQNNPEECVIYKYIMQELSNLRFIQSNGTNSPINIINIVDYFECSKNKKSYFVYEYYDRRQTLHEYIKNNNHILNVSDTISLVV